MNKGTAIVGIWASISAVLITLILHWRIEFMGIMILLGVASIMTVVIMQYEEPLAQAEQ
jgi:hypothetical protein